MRHQRKAKPANYYLDMQAREIARQVEVEQAAWEIMPQVTTAEERMLIRFYVKEIQTHDGWTRLYQSKKNERAAILSQALANNIQTNLNSLLATIG